MTARIVGLWRYPVKGLGGESLAQIEVDRVAGVLGDRRFALRHDGSAYDEAAPAWRPKAEFLQLARDPGLAPLHAHYEPEADQLTLIGAFGLGPSARGCPAFAADRAMLEAFVASQAVLPRRAGHTLVQCDGTIFSDTGRPVVSIVSTETVRALAEAAGCPLDIRRFRGNLVIDGGEPWAEFDWVGRKLWVGSVLLRPVERIGRCAATSVDPATGKVAPELPRLLRDRFGHADCGVYAEILTRGRISLGNGLTPASD